MTATNSDTGNVLTIARDAFKQLDSSEKAAGKGRQMLAYCIMVQHYDDVKDDRKPPSLTALKDSPKAAREYNERLCSLFIGERPKPAKEKSDAVLREATQYRARYAHLMRAIQLAANLTVADVTHLSFDQKAGMFRVASDVICDPNMEPIGSLAKAISVLIDGATYMVERGGKVSSINASLSRISDAATAKRVASLPQSDKVATPTSNGASDTATTGGGSAADIKQKLDTFSLDALLTRAASITNEPSDEPVTRHMMTSEAWNALSDLAAFYEDCLKNEANSKQLKVAA